MAGIINSFFNLIGDTFMIPFRGNAWLAMIAWSLLISVLAITAFKFCSNQTAIARSRNRVFAYILEFRLYKDDLSAVFTIFGRVFASTFAYMGHYLLPIGVMIVPVILLLIQMEGWFEYRPLHPGETALLTATLQSDSDVMTTPVHLSQIPEISKETDALRVASDNQLVWRLQAIAPVAGRIQLSTENETADKTIVVSENMRKISNIRVAKGFWSQLAHPTEPPLPSDSMFQSIEVGYPRRELLIGAMNVNWLLACFVLTIILGLALKPVFKVEL